MAEIYNIKVNPENDFTRFMGAVCETGDGSFNILSDRESIKMVQVRFAETNKGGKIVTSRIESLGEINDEFADAANENFYKMAIVSSQKTEEMFIVEAIGADPKIILDLAAKASNDDTLKIEMYCISDMAINDKLKEVVAKEEAKLICAN